MNDVKRLELHLPKFSSLGKGKEENNIEFKVSYGKALKSKLERLTLKFAHNDLETPLLKAIVELLQKLKNLKRIIVRYSQDLSKVDTWESGWVDGSDGIPCYLIKL